MRILTRRRDWWAPMGHRKRENSVWIEVGLNLMYTLVAQQFTPFYVISPAYSVSEIVQNTWNDSYTVLCNQNRWKSISVWHANAIKVSVSPIFTTLPALFWHNELSFACKTRSLLICLCGDASLSPLIHGCYRSRGREWARGSASERLERAPAP